MKNIVVVAIAGLLIIIAREWDNWVYDVCDCMTNHTKKEDETE